MQGQCLVGYSNDITQKKSCTTNVQTLSKRSSGKIQTRVLHGSGTGKILWDYCGNSNQNEVKYCSNSGTSNSTCSNTTGVRKHNFLHLAVVHTLCLEMYWKNNRWEWDGIGNDTSENGTGTGAMPAGWKQEKKHGNGTTKAFPCKILIQTNQEIQTN